jgi:hypothetical protein
MSARVIPFPSAPEMLDEGIGGSELPRQDPVYPEALGAPENEEVLDARDDSAQFAANLLRRLEIPFPLPWAHGGLNE